MDQGVVRSKVIYRTILVRRITTALDNNKAIPKFNIREGMYMLARVWDQVSTNAVVNCFKKANISARSQIETISDLDDPLSYLK